MEILNVRDLSFVYPTTEKKVLDNINLTIESGAFYLVCGKSGCGKTTLLRQFKPAVTPTGMRKGSILFEGKNIDELSAYSAASDIGFIFQNPETQIVTDTVMAELAFSMESLGMDRDEMLRRIGEMATFFGLETMLDAKTENLSGGEKQLLNLASVMVLNPKLLILDEPTSQLDPIATEEFLNTLIRINRDLGTTVIICEHHLEDVFALADYVVLMENGRLADVAPPRKVKINRAIEAGMPPAFRIWNGVSASKDCPLTVREGQKWVLDYVSDKTIPKPSNDTSFECGKDFAIRLCNISFKYNRSSDDVLSSANLQIPKGEIFGIVGGNGTGKSTALRIMSGGLTPYEGKVFINENRCRKSSDFPLGSGGIVYMPQNPKALFTGISVREELDDDAKLSELGLLEFADMHPYDLSGGQMQKLALGKLMNLHPDIMLLDEPTKGLDPESKEELGQILQHLKTSNVTVVIVSHDLEFIAKFADSVSLCFAKQFIGASSVREFFSKNSFYTTGTNRIMRRVNPMLINADEAISFLTEVRDG